jgi:hypothetical protein
VTQAVVTLAVTAPPGPPASAADFLARLDPGWLQAAYAGDTGALGGVAAAQRALADVALRYRTLLSRLGPGLNGYGRLEDADAWYFILEGTREQSVARGPGQGADRTGRPCRHQPRHRAPRHVAGLR